MNNIDRRPWLMLKATLIVCILSAILTGCTKDIPREPVDTPPPVGDYLMEFAAGAEPDQTDEQTRAMYYYGNSGGTYRWTLNETLSVFILGPDGNLIHDNLKFTSVPESLSPDLSTIRFAGTIPGGRPAEGSTYYAVCPYSADHTFEEDNSDPTKIRHWVSTYIEPEQSHSAIAHRNMPLMASSVDEGGVLSMTFHSMYANIVIPIKFTSSDQSWNTKISSVSLRSNLSSDNTQNTHIAGRGRVDMRTFTDANGFYPMDCSHNWASVTIGQTVKNGSEVTALIVTKEFIIMKNSGLTVDIKTEDGWIARKVFKPNVMTSFSRNQAHIMPELIVDKSDFVNMSVTNNTRPVTTGFRGSGTSRDPYLITSPEEFLGSSDFVVTKYRAGQRDIHIRLTTDIAINSDTWSPLPSMPGGTVFDGGGYTISGKMIMRPEDRQAGLWGALLNGCTIRNLRISADMIGGDGENAGAFASSAGIVTMENCEFSGIMDTNFGTVAGLIGQFNDKTTLKNCRMSGTIKLKTAGYVAGLLGLTLDNDASVRIENCTVSGNANYFCF